MAITDIRLVELNPAHKIAACDLFNEPSFFDLHRAENKAVYLLFEAENKILASIHFTETDENGTWRSPRRGTYSGFQCWDELGLAAISCIVEMTCTYMQQTWNAHKLIIATPPFSHNPHQSAVWFNAFVNHGFTISNQELNYDLAVDEVVLLDKMKRNNKKRYKKCEREGFVFSQVYDDAQIAQVYDVLQQNRTAKGYPMTMSLAQILEMRRIFPENLFFFQATHKHVITASSICIKLNKHVLYVFYWGDLPEFAAHSPVAFLAAGIYEFAQTNKFSMLDIGTATLGGQPNFGLAAFKENLGCTASLKLTYTKQL